MHSPATSQAYRILGTPRFGGILVVADHASNRVPEGIELGIAPELMNEHIAVDIGVAGVAERMVRPGIAAYLGNVSRLVCDFNRDHDVPGIMPEVSDGYAVPGNVLCAQGRKDRIARFFDPYHQRLADLLDETPQALILSLHSFTPRLATCDRPRPWQVGVLYNGDDRPARLAMALFAADDLVVGDQEPYSGKLLNATMNRHAEAEGRPYLSVEVRQDQIADEAGQAEWGERLARICNEVAVAIG